MNTRFGFRLNIPYVTKNLLIINLIFWLISVVVGRMGIDMDRILGLWYVSAPYFHVWQPLTYMFMHAGFSHLFFNMFALWMFGSSLEQYWGSKRYLIYYLATGIGAGVFQELVWWLMGTHHVLTVGASGAVYGILLAFAWLFPNNQMFIFPFPFPIKAKWFVLIFFGIELFEGFSRSDGVAHFAHLGGMLFGVLLILYWKNKGVDTGEGLWDGARLKEWWRRVTETKARREDKSYGNYHYQDPIREDKQEDEEAKRKEAEINRILDKIKLSGYDSLTPEEKQTLFRR